MDGAGFLGVNVEGGLIGKNFGQTGVSFDIRAVFDKPAADFNFNDRFAGLGAFTSSAMLFFALSVGAFLSVVCCPAPPKG